MAPSTRRKLALNISALTVVTLAWLEHLTTDSVQPYSLGPSACVEVLCVALQGDMVTAQSDKSRSLAAGSPTPA